MRLLYFIALFLLVRTIEAADCNTVIITISPTVLTDLTYPVSYYDIGDPLINQILGADAISHNGSQATCNAPFDNFDVTYSDGSPIDASIFNYDGLRTLNTETSDPAQAGLYHLRLIVAFVGYPANTGILDFDVLICGDCCYTTLTIQQSILSSLTINYNVNDNEITEYIDRLLVDSTIAGCDVNYLNITSSGVSLASYPLMYDDMEKLFIYSTNPSEAGTYSLTLKVAISDDIDTPPTHNPSATLDFQVIIHPPCENSVLTIDPAVIAQPITWSVYHPTHTEPVNLNRAFSSQASCDPYIMLVMSGPNFNPVQEEYPGLFNYDSANYELSIQTDDPSSTGTYLLKIVAEFNGYPLTNVEHNFTVTINDPCLIATLTIDPTIFSSTLINYNIGYPDHTEILQLSKVTSSDLTGYCPTVQLSIWSNWPNYDQAVSSCCCGLLPYETSYFTDIFTHSWCTQSDFVINTSDMAYLTTNPNILLQLRANHGELYPNSQQTLPFVVSLIDPCINNVLSFGASIQTYADMYYDVFSGNSAEYWSINDADILQTEVNVDCGEIIMEITNELGSPLDPAIFQFSEILQDFSVWTSSVTGNYNLWLTVYNGVNNHYANNAIFPFTVHLADPCDSATITIASFVIGTNPINYHLFYPMKIDQLMSAAVSSDANPSASCPGFEIAIIYANGSPIDPTVFSYDPVTEQLETFSQDFNKIDTYTMKITAKHTGSIATPAEFVLTVNIIDNCHTATLTIDPGVALPLGTTYDYLIGYPQYAVTMDLNGVSSTLSTSMNPNCPPIIFSFEAPQDGLLTQNVPNFSATSAYVSWFTHEFSTAQFVVETSDLNLEASYLVILKARYTGSSTASLPVLITFNLHDPCTLATLTLDISQFQTYFYEVYEGNAPDVYTFDASTLVTSSEITVDCPQIILELYNHDGATMPPTAFVSLAEAVYPLYSLTFDTENQSKVSPPNYGVLVKAKYDTLNYVVEVDHTPIVMTLTNYCYQATLNILSDIFLPWTVVGSNSGTVTITYNLYSTETINFDDLLVDSDVDPSITCGDVVFSVSLASGGTIDPTIFTLDANQDFTIHSDDASKVGNYQMELSAGYLGGFQSQSAFFLFEVQINNSCDTEVLSINPLILSSQTLNYQIGYLSPTGLQETLDPSFVSSTDTSGLCPSFLLSVWTDDNVSHSTLSSVVIAELGLNQAASNDFSIFTTDLATEGTYSLYLEARYEGLYDWQDTTHNGRLSFAVNLINPCKLATLTIDPSVFTGGVTSFQYHVQHPNSSFFEFLEPNPEQYVTSSEATAACPSIVIDVINQDDSPLNSLAMIYSENIKDLVVNCADVAQVGMYDLKVVAKYDDPTYPPEDIYPFQLELIDLCLAPTITVTGQMPVPDYEYAGTATFTLAPFTISPGACAIAYSCTKTYGSISSCTESSPPPLTFATTWDGFEFNLAVGEMVELAPGTYAMNIDAVGGTNLDVSASHTFTITLVDPCPASTLAMMGLGPWSGQNVYTYILRDPSNTWTWNNFDLASNLSTVIDCGPFEVSFFILGGVDLSLYAGYTQGTFTVEYQEQNVGTHIVSYQVSYSNYPESGPIITCLACFTLIVIDPCDPPTSITLDFPLEDQVYTVDYPAMTYDLPDFTTDPAWCETPTYNWALTGSLYVYNNHSFDTEKGQFTFDEPVSLASTPYDLTTTSTSIVAPYYKEFTLGVEAELNGLISSTYTFTLFSENPCIEADYNWINIPATTLNSVIYKINSDQLLIEDIVSQFSVESNLCGGFEITVDTLAAQNSWPGVVVYEADVLSIYTTDLNLAGQTVNILIQPSLIDYPTYSFHTPTETFDQSSMSVILPITLEECVVTQIDKPVLDDIIYYYGDSSVEIVYTDFISDEGPECNYFWTYTIEIQSSSSLNNAIETDINSKTITIEAETGEDQEATLVLNGVLSNDKTTDSVEFLITLKNQIDQSEEEDSSDIEAGLNEDEEEVAEDTQEEGEVVRTDEEAVIDQQVEDYREAFLALEEQWNSQGYTPEFEPPVPYLSGIQQQGTVVVSFSQSMRIIPDLAMITNGTVVVDGQRQPVFDVEIIPGIDSDNSKLSFEWNILQMTDREIAIQIYFESAVHVSSNYEPDTLRLSFVDKYMFVATNDLPINIDSAISFNRRRNLRIKSQNHQNYDYDSDSPQILTLERVLPTQLQYGLEAELVQDAVTTVGESSKTVLLVSFTMNVFISASLNQVWSLINTQQLIVLMSLFKTEVPANAGTFFSQIMEIAAFDIIETGDTLDEWLELPPIEPENPKFGTLGLGSIFLLNNMGTLALAYMFWFLTSFFAGLVSLGKKKSKHMKNMYRKLQRKLFFNSILSLFMESYSLIAVCCLINLSYLSFATYGFTFHSVVCILFTVALILLPMIFITFLRQSFEDLETRYMKEKYGSLYEGLNLQEGRKVLLIPIFFLFRRLLLALLVVVINQALIWQVFLMSMQIVSSVILIGNVRPFVGRKKFYTENFNEIILMFVMYTIICFSPFVSDVEVRFQIGYICIFIVCLHLAVNLVIIIRTTLINFKFKLRMRSAKKAHEKQRQRLNAKLAENHENRRIRLQKRRAKVDKMLKLNSSEDEGLKEEDLMQNQIFFGGQPNVENEPKPDSVKTVNAQNRKVHPQEEEDEMDATGILATNIGLNFKESEKKKNKHEKFNYFISAQDDKLAILNKIRDLNLQEIEQQTHELLADPKIRQKNDEFSFELQLSELISKRSSNLKKSSAANSSLDFNVQFSSDSETPWVSGREMTSEACNTDSKMITSPNISDDLDKQLILFEMQDHVQKNLPLRPKKVFSKVVVDNTIEILKINCDDTSPDKKREANTALWKKSKTMQL